MQMTTALAEKLSGVRDFKKILETTVKELGETYACDISQIVLSNPLDRNITSICEYRIDPDNSPGDIPNSLFPLHLQGGGLGMVSLARQNPPLTVDEINYITITLKELADVIRYAQINDIVQRDTFRETFLVEIGNLMNYSLGIGDALFMVVNILGKALNSSRCLFICVDDDKSGWKCYEFWQQGRVKSCQEYGWPTTDSPTVAQSLLSSAPVIVYEGQQNSYMTPLQEELQLIGARSLLAVPLRSQQATHGCIIVQQCDSRHAWTRGEIDMVQRVADTVAEALSRLPEEKKAREPIMRLHQREVVEAGNGDRKESIQVVRRALKGALGTRSIPAAQKSPPPGAEPAPQIKSSGPHQLPSPTVQAGTGSGAAAAAPATPHSVPGQESFSPPPPAGPGGAATSHAAAPPDGLLGEIQPGTAQAASAAGSSGKWGDLDAIPTPGTGAAQGGGWSNVNSIAAPDAAGATSAPTGNSWGDPDVPTPGSAAAAAPQTASSQWGDLDVPTPGSAAAATAQPVAATGGDAATGQPVSQWGNLDAIPTPGAGADGQVSSMSGAWGNLDAIPTPANSSSRGLLSSQMMSRARAANTGQQQSALKATFHKDKARYQPQATVVDGPPIQIDDNEAKNKIEQVLAQSTSATSDYIFATPGIDVRLLGRIDSWVSQVEAKDKYTTSHALAVSQYSLAMGKLLALPQAEMDILRLAAICHDVGKLGIPAATLQKPEDDLDDAELILLMKHPIDGAELVKPFPELAPIAAIILSHHEEYSGNGYPEGRRGDEIPLAARIIHVASEYHGLVTPLRYRPALSAQEAQQAMRSQAGKVFDPALVEVLIACVVQGMVTA